MFSPPSSPPPQSPPPQESPESSVPSSPPSSPLTSPHRPVKKRCWEVFGFRDGASQACPRTLLRWGNRGLVPQNFGQEDCRDEASGSDGCAPQHTNKEPQDSDCESVLESSDSVPPSEAPSDIDMRDSSSDTSCNQDNRWFDSDEETFHEQVLIDNSDDHIDDNHPLYPGSKYSKDEAILDLMDDYFNNRETQKSLKDHLATFIKYLPHNNSMPKSVYLLFSFLKKLAPSYVYHPKFYCSECLLYLSNNFQVCSVCGDVPKKQFYMFDLEEQIRFYFEHYNLAELIDKYSENNSHIDNKITDICHGSEYKRLRVDGKYNITLVWNTDGVSLSKSSHCHLYPVLAIISELPPRVRSRFIIVAGVWCDKVAPPMNTLLRPFCDSLVAINNEGGVSWTNPQSGEQFKSVVSAPLCIADAPVRAQIQNIQSHNSKHACNTCEQKTKSIPLTAAQRAAKAAGERNIRKKRGFLFENPGAQLRTGSRMLKQARKAFFDRKTVKGVVGPSVVSQIPRLDLGTCVLGEYMHGTCLGVTRYFTNIFVNVPGGAWYIGDKIDEIDNFLECLKPCDYICRLPRKISELFKWKASELRAWLLFYSVIVLSRVMPHNYAQHWMLFVMAIWLLLQDEITDNDLQRSKSMLILFVRDIGRLYGQASYVYNVHQLLHLPLYVKRWGPLWATSAFMFESYNGTIAELIHGTKNRGKELVNLVKISHGLQILREQVQMKSEKRGNVRERTYLSSECRPSILSDEDKTFLVSSGVTSSFRIFARATVNKELFTSILCKETKRINFCVGFKEGEKVKYAEVLYYIAFDETELAVVRCLKVDQLKLFIHEPTRSVLQHILPVMSSDTLQLISVNSLFKVLKVDSCIALMPNTYEKSL
ncbi:B-cell linker protein [Frankliniella fusca]|uniref:B-cell linker protein n=1 Tax=Frankliniella fusca TaxID=407009 RepID=A0AAE1HED2_9NEOP|nr:B-cell linker protein [Frankliniella fusca]